MWVVNIYFNLLILALLTIIDTEADSKACEQKEKHNTVLDLAKELVTKAKDLQPGCVNDPKDTSSNSSDCGAKERVSAYLDIANNLIDAAKDNFSNCDDAGDQKKEVTKEEKKDEKKEEKKDEKKEEKKDEKKEEKKDEKKGDEKEHEKDEKKEDKKEEKKDEIKEDKKEEKKDEIKEDKKDEKKDEIKEDKKDEKKDEIKEDKKEEKKDEIKEEKKEEILKKKAIDCSEILKNGEGKSGQYVIYPKNDGEQLKVYCDMDTDGGGWTLIQRRGSFPNKIDFHRNWSEYKNGFGNISEEFWIGNDNIFALTNQRKQTVRFDLENVNKEKRFATYSSFWVEDENAAYKLHFDKYSGTAGDGIKTINNMKFSTKDRENNNAKCSSSRMGGWWYNFCGTSNPNGVNDPEGKKAYKYMNWHTFSVYDSLLAIEIKIRPEN